MSGHSKWETIKRAKGANDAKRGVLFTKLGNQIAIAARAGADPDMNFALRLAIDTAKSHNMPMSNIERAIQRVTDKSAEQVEEVVYEGYGPGGTAILIECATNNRNRTFPEVRSTFTKCGGAVAEPGSVAFQFTRKGVIRIKETGDDALLAALDAGAEDAVESDGEMVVYTELKDLAKVRTALVGAGLSVLEASLRYEPNAKMEITDPEVARKVVRLLDTLDELDDTVQTYTNFDIADGVEL
jgi:YebC/PmpR family DNA-binding regulatory protein